MIKGSLLLSAPIIKSRVWFSSRRPLLPAAGSQYTAVMLPIPSRGSSECNSSGFHTSVSICYLELEPD